MGASHFLNFFHSFRSQNGFNVLTGGKTSKNITRLAPSLAKAISRVCIWRGARQMAPSVLSRSGASRQHPNFHEFRFFSKSRNGRCAASASSWTTRLKCSLWFSTITSFRSSMLSALIISTSLFLNTHRFISVLFRRNGGKENWTRDQSGWTYLFSVWGPVRNNP